MVMENGRKLDRTELIQRPRKDRRRNGNRKYVLCTKWDPRQPNIRMGLNLLEEVMYLSEENKKVFPKGSIISGFRRQRKVGEYVAPTKPKRILGGAEGGGGCFPCDAPRSCTLHQSGALQVVTKVKSRFDGVWHNINKRITCSTPNVIYFLCPSGHTTDYIGSTKDMKDRWSKHKRDIRQGRWQACGLTKHFGVYHTGDLEVAISNLKVTLVDHWVGVLRENVLRKLKINGW